MSNRSSVSDWLKPGSGDLREEVVEDVPVKGQSVLVRGLAAQYSNEAAAEALEYGTGRRGEQTMRVNNATLEVLQFAHGVVEPKFTLEEARQVAQRFGPAFKKVIAKIDELSGVSKEAVDNADAAFPGVPAANAGNGADAPS